MWGVLWGWKGGGVGGGAAKACAVAVHCAVIHPWRHHSRLILMTSSRSSLGLRTRPIGFDDVTTTCLNIVIFKKPFTNCDVWQKGKKIINKQIKQKTINPNRQSIPSNQNQKQKRRKCLALTVSRKWSRPFIDATLRDRFQELRNPRVRTSSWTRTPKCTGQYIYIFLLNRFLIIPDRFWGNEIHESLSVIRDVEFWISLWN